MAVGTASAWRSVLSRAHWVMAEPFRCRIMKNVPPATYTGSRASRPGLALAGAVRPRRTKKMITGTMPARKPTTAGRMGTDAGRYDLARK